MKFAPLVSVVIPIFNEEKYLSQCIESVLSQTYTNFECIIVNNCSTDSSLEIAKHFEKLDNRIIVYTNDRFLGMLENHNNSLKAISLLSKYCKMVLGDDLIFRDCIGKMVEVAESDPAVGIVSSYRLWNEKISGTGLLIGNHPVENNVYNGKDICRRHLLKGDIELFGSQTTLLYRSDIIRKKAPFFNESCFFADAEVCYEILKNNKFGFVNQILSFSRIQNDTAFSPILMFGPELPSKLGLLIRFGEHYLNKEEYKIRYNKILDEYYKYLGWKYFTNRNKEFLEFHGKEFNNSGISINKKKLYKYASCYFIDKMLNPKKTIEDIIKRKNIFKSNNIEKMI